MRHDEYPSRAAVERALHLQKEVALFQAAWPAPAHPVEPVPPISWDQLLRQLEELAPTTVQRNLVRDLLATTRGLAALKPPEMVLREILCVASTVMQEGLYPEEAKAPA